MITAYEHNTSVLSPVNTADTHVKLRLSRQSDTGYICACVHITVHSNCCKIHQKQFW